MNTSLSRLDQASRMLAEIRSVDDARAVVDLAEAARIYAQQVLKSAEAQNHAAEIKLRAQRRGGEILREMDLKPGPKPSTNYSQPASNSLPEGVSHSDSSRWQAIAALPVQEFEEYIEAAKEGGEVTTSAVLKVAKRHLATQRPEAPPLPSGKFRVLYADPPWKYGDSLLDGYGPAEFHYPSLSIDELCALPISALADDNAVLFLWATSPLLEDALRVLRAWGFAYKTSFVWDKEAHNFGHYNSVRHEFLLLGTRGSCIPDKRTLYDSVQSIPRGKHSEKPERFREIIDDIYDHGERVELFARRECEGWKRWGNE